MNSEYSVRTIHNGRHASRAPGVYYDALVTQTAQPAFRTGIPLFVGFAQTTSAKITIRHISRLQQFEEWREPLSGSYLRYAVRGFFENGGMQCVVTLVHSDPENMAKALTDVFADGSVLEDLEDIDLVCVPDAMLEIIRKPDCSIVQNIQSAVLEHCRRMGDRFAILDGFLHDEDGKRRTRGEAQIGVEFAISHGQNLRSEYGALYYPWVFVKKHCITTNEDILHAAQMPCDIRSDSSADTHPRFINPHVAERIPPCGHIAGIYSRTDSRVGVHKAPANEILEEVLALEMYFNDADQATLNDAGINCLRSFAGRGIRVWGARTLSGQPHWAYVNVRRLFLTLARRLKINMSDLVYEINDQHLWERVRERLIDYCQNLFEQGALVGSRPGEAFFVKCDAETNPPESRELGYVVADVGLAPAIPAEFIMVRITQRAGTIAVTGLEIS